MPTVTVEDAQARLPDLIAGLRPGESVVITRGPTPVARLTAEEPPRVPRVPGSAKGVLVVVAEDDDHLRDFEEYMG